MKRCNNCKFYEERTKFCRGLPPQPIVIQPSTSDKELILSKFPIVVQPNKDWCGLFSRKSNENLLFED